MDLGDCAELRQKVTIASILLDFGVIDFWSRHGKSEKCFTYVRDGNVSLIIAPSSADGGK